MDKEYNTNDRVRPVAPLLDAVVDSAARAVDDGEGMVFDLDIRRRAFVTWAEDVINQAAGMPISITRRWAVMQIERALLGQSVAADGWGGEDPFLADAKAWALFFESHGGHDAQRAVAYRLTHAMAGGVR